MKNLFFAFVVFLLFIGCSYGRDRKKEITRDSLFGTWICYEYKHVKGEPDADQYVSVGDGGPGINGVTFNFRNRTRERITILELNAGKPDTMSYILRRTSYESILGSWEIASALSEEWDVRNDSLFTKRRTNKKDFPFITGDVPNWYKIMNGDTLNAVTANFKILKLNRDTLLLEMGRLKKLYRRADTDSATEKIIKQERKKRRR